VGKIKIMSKKSGEATYGFNGLLTILFIVLKLTNVIDWSWWWVFAPLWIPVAFLVTVVTIMFFVFWLAILIFDE
jgi:hypothetical protein